MNSFGSDLRTIILLLAGAFSTFAVPPYLWYSTYSVEDYYSNGCSPFFSLGTCHDDADGFSNAITSLNIPSNVLYRFNRRDTACTAERWTGTNAEINFADFVFYAGHGCGSGPYFGCSTNYLITNTSDIRFGGTGNLKWVQAAACEWFVLESLDRCNIGLNEYERWDNSFAGVHTVQGHRAITYEFVNSDSMSGEFWNRWVNHNNSIYLAWRNAQIRWVYEEIGNLGLQPATAASNNSFAYELWQNATDTLAPYGMDFFGWATVGTPQY